MAEKNRMDSQYEGMLSEDHSAPANLPQHVVHKYYKKNQFIEGYEVDDTIKSVDDTRREEIKKIEDNMSSDKY